MNTLSALLVVCQGNPPVTSHTRPVMRNLRVVFCCQPEKAFLKLNHQWLEKSWFSCDLTLMFWHMLASEQLGPLLVIIPELISNHKPRKLWDKITYPIPNFNGCFWNLEWISNFILHFIMDVITYPCWDQSQSVCSKSAPAVTALKHSIHHHHSKVWARDMQLHPNKTMGCIHCPCCGQGYL